MNIIPNEQNNNNLYSEKKLLGTKGSEPLDNFIYSEKSENKAKASKLSKVVGENIAIVADKFYTPELRQELVDSVKEMEYKAKRLNITVNGNKIDVLLVGKADQFDNGRWILYSNPNGVLYEDYAGYREVNDRIDRLQTNYLFFNYPGVGESEGETSQQNCIDTYQGMLSYLENEVKAKEIIGWGTSIGGGVQGAALEDYKFNDEVRYVFVKEQTFSNLSKVPQEIVGEIVPKKFGGKVLSGGLSALGIGLVAKKVMKSSERTLDSRNSSRQLEDKSIPEIVIQNTKKGVSVPTSNKDIVGDGMISSHASLARALLKEKTDWKNKDFIGVHSEHLGDYTEDEFKQIENTILEKLKPLPQKEADSPDSASI